MAEPRRVLIGIGGGIAAYKVCEVISRLYQVGIEVRAILTETAQQFVPPLTISTLSRHRAYTDSDFWCPTNPRPLHIELGEWAELIVIAPLTANSLGKLAHGFADNLLTNTVLASRCPILLAPAMNTDMWEQESVQKNWQSILENSRYHGLNPGAGLLACDRLGAGRMAEPSAIVSAVHSLLHTGGKRDLLGKHLLISTGGTREFIDPVRFIGNPATGKMGVALTQAALHRGARVTLVYANTDTSELANDGSLQTVKVSSAAEMGEAMLNSFPEADCVLMSAAVADVKPANYSPEKLPKKDIPLKLPLVPVPDILAQLGRLKQRHQLLVGFAAQTGNIVKPALEKLKQKNLDAIAANPIDQPLAGFGVETNQAILIDAKGRQEQIENCSKLQFSHHLLDFVGSIVRD
jgi:phosphopantothenoylcysteine decarboxylase/phosphopantothenate--cysteine ligase